MGIEYYRKGLIEQISKDFKACEFDCPCDHCACTLVDSELVSKLQELRERIGKPIAITSGYRCTSYQNELKARGYETAVGVSQHTLGRAADIAVSGLGIPFIISEAILVGFKAIGAGENFLHLDTRDDGKTRYWNYKKR